MSPKKKTNRTQNKTITENLRLVFVLGWTSSAEFYGEEFGFKVSMTDVQEMEAHCKELVLDPKKNGSPIKIMDGYFNRTILKYRQIIGEYSRHKDECIWWNSDKDECDCGLDKIMTSIKLGEEIS